VKIGSVVGLVPINVQQPLTIAAVAAGVSPTMCSTHPRCQRLAATIVEEELELAATFVEEELELVATFLPINRQQESKANGDESGEKCREHERKWRAAMAAAASAARELGVEFE
jgi:hypothetical protein